MPLYRDKNEKFRFSFLDEAKPDSRSYELVDKISGVYYLYNFYSDGKQLTLLAEENLDAGEYRVDGTLINCPDSSSIGESFKVPVELPIVISLKNTNKVCRFKTVDEFKLFLISIKFDWNVFSDYLFYNSEKEAVFHFPDNLELLSTAFIFSRKYDGYPLHLLVWGPPHIGKSLLLECLDSKFKETVGIIDGGGSTLKGLVPSFKGTTTEPGALAKASHVCLVDEFLRIMIRTGSDTESRDDLLAALNTLLEHKPRRFTSGNCGANFKMGARALFVTNPLHMYNTIDRLFERISSPFISRLFLYPIYGETLTRLRRNIEDETTVRYVCPEFVREDFLSIVEYLQSVQSEYDDARLRVIYAAYGNKMSDKFKEVYSRYIHHCRCLLDGIVKTRCLRTRDFSFKAIDEDYRQLNDLLAEAVFGWSVV